MSLKKKKQTTNLQINHTLKDFCLFSISYYNFFFFSHCNKVFSLYYARSAISPANFKGTSKILVYVSTLFKKILINLFLIEE